MSKFGKMSLRMACASSLVLCPVVLAAQDGGVRDHGWQHYPPSPVVPAGAPNILVVMTDDIGFGAASSFGGPIPTPNLDRLAQRGLRYNRFHTTAMCSPTRAALLTGRNEHAVNSGSIGDLSVDKDGYTSVIPDSAATIGEVFHENGYQTAWIGKNHNTPLWENSSVGPFDRWPNGLGFDYFYGFNAAYANQFYPTLFENRTQLEPKYKEGEVLDKDLADHAIDWLRLRSSLARNTPFLLYYAPGAAHAPVQAPKAWIEKFKGKFDNGWDETRKSIYRNQLIGGTVPKSTQLTPRPKEIPSWDSLTPDERKANARLMEVYAAMVSYSDDQFGRIIDELDRMGELDNTLIVFIEGDNGSAAESYMGDLNEVAMFSQISTVDQDAAHVEDIGGANSQPVLSAGWAWAMNTPFQWAKQIASHFGGTRNGMVISWPARIKQTGELRTQFHNVTDIAPTLYEAAGIAPPEVVRGVKQQPIDGVSIVYSFGDAKAKSHRTSQYFEMLGNRAYYKDGWIAATTPRRMPWSAAYLRDDYPWELYNVEEDFSEARDLSKKYPGKLKELQGEFQVVAAANHVLPIDDSFLPRFDAVNRPSVFGRGTEFTFYSRKNGFLPAEFPSLTTNWTVIAKVNIVPGDISAPLFVRGNKFGGWGIFLENGHPMLVYKRSHLDRDEIILRSGEKLSLGQHDIEVRFKKQMDGTHLLSLWVDNKLLESRRIPSPVFPRTETYIGRQGEPRLVQDPRMSDFAGSSLVDVKTLLKGQ